MGLDLTSLFTPSFGFYAPIVSQNKSPTTDDQALQVGLAGSALVCWMQQHVAFAHALLDLEGDLLAGLALGDLFVFDLH